MFQKKPPAPKDFQSRVQAYEAARKKGLVFQAEGTLGGVPLRHKRPKRKSGRIFALILVLSILFAMKAALLAYVGPDTYRSKLAPYAASAAPQDRAIAYVMQTDAVTVWVAKLFAEVTFSVRKVVKAYTPEPLEE